MVSVDKTFEPEKSKTDKYHEMYMIYKELYPTLKELNHKISAQDNRG